MNTGSSKANIGLLEPEKEEYMENIINLGQAFNFVKFGIMDDDGTIRKINPSSYGVTKDGRLYYLNSDGVALHQKGELHLIANSGEWEPVDMDVLTSEDPNQRWKLADSNSSSPEAPWLSAARLSRDNHWRQQPLWYLHVSAVRQWK